MTSSIDNSSGTIRTPFISNFIAGTTLTPVQINTMTLQNVNPFAIGKFRVVINDGRVLPIGSVLPPYFEVIGGYTASTPIQLAGDGGANIGFVVSSAPNVVRFNDLVTEWEVTFDRASGIQIRKTSILPVGFPVRVSINQWIPIDNNTRAYLPLSGIF